MIIFPAIDIKDGKVVRLEQGKFDQVTNYGSDPVEMARHWEKEGTDWLHLVDLDGAKTGVCKNIDQILRIADATNVNIQIGGGLREEADIQKLLQSDKIKRVILGTKAIEDLNFLKKMVKTYDKRIAVSLDCKDGFLAQRGWVSTTTIKAIDFVKELEAVGVACVIYTDIARDGMLTGPNYERLDELLATTRIPVIASGGIANIEDIKKLKTREKKGMLGAITGKAIYEGKLNLKEALKVAKA